MLKEITEPARAPRSEPIEKGPERLLPAMSRLMLSILPALFAVAAALLWEPVGEFLGGLQQPLLGQEHTLAKGFPDLKLNDGRHIPIVCTWHFVASRSAD